MHRFFLCFVLMYTACQMRNPALDTNKNLINAMHDYLYKQVNNDSSNVKYNVQNVTYFDDKKKYICEFKVHMKTKLFDTTGIMKAYISEDFKDVKRLY